jgi:hypothetical protein
MLQPDIAELAATLHARFPAETLADQAASGTPGFHPAAMTASLDALEDIWRRVAVAVRVEAVRSIGFARRRRMVARRAALSELR